MHTQDTQVKFISYRAQGWSLAHIATELNVARSTLIEWSRKYRFDIQNLRAFELDELRNTILGNRKDRLQKLADILAKVEQELEKRDLTQLPTARLFSLADSLRRQIERETADTHFATPINDIPEDEYVEQIQEWKP